MLAHNLALGQILPASQQGYLAHDRPAEADARAIAARLRVAERLLPGDPDAAALLLDGMLGAIAALWLACRARRASPLQSAPLSCGNLVAPLLPALVEGDDSHFGLRLRLGLRAPNAEARLTHCRDMLRLLEADEGDQHHVG